MAAMAWLGRRAKRFADGLGLIAKRRLASLVMAPQVYWLAVWMCTLVSTAVFLGLAMVGIEALEAVSKTLGHMRGTGQGRWAEMALDVGFWVSLVGAWVGTSVFTFMLGGALEGFFERSRRWAEQAIADLALAYPAAVEAKAIRRAVGGRGGLAPTKRAQPRRL